MRPVKVLSPAAESATPMTPSAGCHRNDASESGRESGDFKIVNLAAVLQCHPSGQPRSLGWQEKQDTRPDKMGSARHELSDVTAAILCGGLGSRLQPVLADRPKTLAEVGGRPFLHYLLDQLENAGVRRCVLLTGHMGDMVEAAIPPRWGDLAVHFSRESRPLDTGGALRLALDSLDPGLVLVMNGDSWCETDLHALRDFHLHHPAHATLVASRVPDTGRYGSLRTNPDHRVLGFQEKAAAQGPGLASAGIYLLHRGLVERIPPNHRISLERELFPHWARRVGVYAFETGSPFIDIGTPDSLASADEFLFTQSRHATAITGDALCEPGASRIASNGAA